MEVEGFCRGCLQKYSEPTDLLQYTEKNRRLFVYSTGLQVKRNDTFTFQLCKECFYNMKQSCKFKKQCRMSDKLIKNYLNIKDESGDSVGFASFINNMNENLSLRFSLNPIHSTPAHQKFKDDDNESTCTSIRNFITDILDGEDMPPTEARIIREVIEEEADVLDDSLDSHWLQDDDLSIASDFNMDYGSFSPFATPRSVRNEHYYTPRRIEESKQQEVSYLTPNKIVKHNDQTRISQQLDMPILDKGFEDINPVERNENDDTKHNIEDFNDQYKEAPQFHEFNNSIPSEVEDMVTENSISSKLKSFQTDLLAVKKKNDRNSDLVNFDENAKDSVPSKDICIVLNQGMAGKKTGDKYDIPVDSELELYISKAKRKSEARVQSSAKKKAKDGTHCTIDRNLEIALENEGSKDIPLHQLLESPQVSIQSGASTPTINKILYGGKYDDDTVRNSYASVPLLRNLMHDENMSMKMAPKYFPQVGQSIEDFDENVTVKTEVETYYDSEINDRGETTLLKDLIKYEEEIKLEDVNDDKSENIYESEVKTVESENIYESEVKTVESENICEVEVKTELLDIEPNEVLEEFLKAAESSPLKDNVLNQELLNQNMDLLDKNKDEDIFKIPFPPPHDKYDLDKCLCKICKKTFNSAKAVKIHFCKTHKFKIPTSDPHRNHLQNNKCFICVTCGINIKGAANYARHKKNHKDKGEYQCHYCNVIYKSRMSLVRHIKAHIAKEQNITKYVCDICGSKQTSLGNLTVHQRRHFKEFQMTCKFCGKGFYTYNELKIHMYKHTGERPYPCAYCTKAFTRSQSLIKHHQRHMGIAEHKCTFCDIAFVSKTLLHAHFGTKKCENNRKNKINNVLPKDSNKIKESRYQGSLDKIRTVYNLRQPKVYNVNPPEQNISKTEKSMLEPKMGKDSDLSETDKLNTEELIENNIEPSEQNIPTTEKSQHSKLDNNSDFSEDKLNYEHSRKSIKKNINPSEQNIPTTEKSTLQSTLDKNSDFSEMDENCGNSEKNIDPSEQNIPTTEKSTLQSTLDKNSDFSEMDKNCGNSEKNIDPSEQNQTTEKSTLQSILDKKSDFSEMDKLNCGNSEKNIDPSEQNQTTEKSTLQSILDKKSDFSEMDKLICGNSEKNIDPSEQNQTTEKSTLQSILDKKSDFSEMDKLNCGNSEKNIDPSEQNQTTEKSTLQSILDKKSDFSEIDKLNCGNSEKNIDPSEQNPTTEKSTLQSTLDKDSKLEIDLEYLDDNISIKIEEVNDDE